MFFCPSNFLYRDPTSAAYLWISSERAKADFSGRDGPNGIYDYRDEGLLEILVEHLRRHIDSGQPAAVSGMTVVPAYGVLLPANL